jgi:hypothetical protein
MKLEVQGQSTSPSSSAATTSISAVVVAFVVILFNELPTDHLLYSSFSPHENTQDY